MREGWTLKNIGEVAKIVAGGTPKTKIKEYWNGNIAWITPADMGKLTTRVVAETKRTITKKGLEKSSAKLFPANSVILSSRAPIGHLAINTIPMATNQGCRGIVPKTDLDTTFLYYFLKCNIKLLENLGAGTTFKELSTKALASVIIPIPPLSEQKQIVAILDQAFDAIDQAKANIEKNIENAKELFQSKLNEIFSQNGEGWEEKSLGAVCEIKPPKKLAKEQLKEIDLVSFVPMKYLEVNQLYFNSNETKTLKKAYSGYVYFQDGDVVLAKITPCFENGKLGIAKDLVNGIGFGSSEYVVYRTKELLLPEFLYFYLNREAFRIKGKSLMAGAVGHKRIQPEFYEKELINYPGIVQQQDICSKIIELQKQLNFLESQYHEKIDHLEELKKSILEIAFAGELTEKEMTT